MAKASGGKASAKKAADMSPFFREQVIARRIYSQLMQLDKPARRRVLGIVNDYAMTAATREPTHQFKLEDEEDAP